METLILNTEKEIPTVKIDETHYKLRIDMNYAQMLAHQRINKKMTDITKLESLTETEEVDLQKSIDLIMEMIIDAPEEVLDKLTDIQKFQIMKVFNDQLKEYMDPLVAVPNMNN